LDVTTGKISVVDLGIQDTFYFIFYFSQFHPVSSSFIQFQRVSSSFIQFHPVSSNASPKISVHAGRSTLSARMTLSSADLFQRFYRSVGVAGA